MTALAAVGAAFYVMRAPPCKGKLVTVKSPKGPMVCFCEQGRRGACFDPGP
jgi:hypothetical protein